jgi:hypothetical protein
MNNKPVAYINKDDGLVCAKCYKPFTKELTDEEILQFQDKVPYTLGSDLIDFARAILRKAQEK